MKSSAMGSSKYEFNPEQFDKDVNSKREVARRFEEDLKRVLHKDYKYNDDTKMSEDWKKSILVKVHLEFLGLDK